MKRNQISVQMYCLHAACQADFPATLKLVAGMGFKNIEFAGLHGHDPKVIFDLMSELGLTARSAHVGFDLLLEDFDATMAQYAVFGKLQIIIPWLKDECFTDLAAAQKTVANMRMVADKVTAMGYECGFHNHWKELTEKFEDGSCIWEMLYSEENKSAKPFPQPDLAWIKRGGLDPIAELKRLGKLVRNIHIKDVDAENNGVPVGTGLIDWVEIMRVAEHECGTEWYTIEVEAYGDEKHEQVQLALKNLIALAND